MPPRRRQDTQPDLFGGPPPRDAVDPVAVDDDLRGLAGRLPPGLALGTSSWSFPGWEGIVYAGPHTESQLARRGLAAYAQHPLLRAVGVDRTFYAPIAAADFRRYAEAVPASFRFLVKAHSALTMPAEQRQRWSEASAAGRDLFLDVQHACDQVIAPAMTGLGAKCGAIVFQFPPLGAAARDPARFAGRLFNFLDALPRGPVYAVEIRNHELIGKDYAEALRRAGVVHCYNVHARMPSIAEQRRQLGDPQPGRPVVARWMLHAGFEYEEAKERYAPFSRLVDPDPASRSDLANLAVDALRIGRPTLIIANNKAEGSAPLTLVELARLIDARRPGAVA
jgi:uncharacterized protein YecE (DUF72 family)